MNKLQLKHRELKIISVIAASENISHAATVLGIAQANVSKYLADFESKVGLKVFDRTTRQLTLTPFGIALLPYINDMLDRNEQLNNFIADYKHEKRGKVTVYAPTGIIAYLSQHVIAKIMDIGDISLVLKTYNLERKAFYALSTTTRHNNRKFWTFNRDNRQWLIINTTAQVAAKVLPHVSSLSQVAVIS